MVDLVRLSRDFVHGTYLVCPSDAADSFQGEAVVHAMLSDQPPLHHHSSSAMPGCSGVPITVVLGPVNQRSSLQDITTCLKRFDGSTDAPVETLDASYTLIFGEEQL